MGRPIDLSVVIQIPMEVWLGQARSGCAEALGMALEACRTELQRLAAAELPPNLRSKEDVSDLVQETFYEASRDLQQFSGQTGAEWRAWLRRIFQHNLQHVVRRYRGTAMRQVDHEVSFHQLELWGFSLGGLAADDASTPSVHAMKNEQAELLAAAMGQLSERDRRALAMRYQERRTLEEVAHELGCTPAGARKICLRALERLRIELDLSSPVQ